MLLSSLSSFQLRYGLPCGGRSPEAAVLGMLGTASWYLAFEGCYPVPHYKRLYLVEQRGSTDLVSRPKCL
jgi:hypothetical protein